MERPQTPVLRYIGGNGGDGRPPALNEFVGGPRHGERERPTETPETIEAASGTYRRSVQCADDGVLRYVFEANPTETL
jgi:hypothetical protein